MPTILVTGATDGIGKQTAFELAERGAAVIVHGRTAAKAKATLEELRKRTQRGSFRAAHGDFSSLAEVRALAESVGPLDVLLHNAGLFAERREVTKDGFELTFQVNHLAPFVLTHLALANLRAGGRIVLVASMAHSSGRIDFDDLQMKRGFDGHRAYSTSKLMNILFGYELARRLEGRNIAVNSLHPGVISTKLLHTGFGMGGAPLAHGAKTSVKVAIDPALEGISGRYFSNERESQSSAASHDRATQRRLYDLSCELGGVEAI